MRVLVLSHLYPAPGRTGGMFVHEQAKALRDLGVDLQVVSPTPFSLGLGRLHPRLRARASTPRGAVRDGIVIQYPRVISLPRRLLSAHSGEIFAVTLRRLLPGLRADSIQLVHAHQAMPDGAAGLLLARELGVPLVLTVHGVDVHDHLVSSDAVAERTRQVLRSATRVVAVSSRVAEQLSDVVPADRLSVNLNGVRAPLAAARPERTDAARPVLLSVARLIPSKGHDDVLKALPAVRAAGFDPVWLVVGDGPYRGALETAVAASGLGDCVKMMGHLPHSDVLDLMGQADVFVLPSAEEGFGLVYAEAMAQSTVAIACAGEGPADFIVDGESGFLVPPHDPAALAQAIITCLKGPDLRRRVGLAGREAVSELTWPANARRQLEVYEAALADDAQGGRAAPRKLAAPPSSSVH